MHVLKLVTDAHFFVPNVSRFHDDVKVDRHEVRSINKYMYLKD